MSNIDHEIDDGCPSCIKRKQEEDEATKEMMMISPPHIKQMYEKRNTTTASKHGFELIRAEKTPEEIKREEEERIKLAEFYKRRKIANAKREAKTGIPAPKSELDLEAQAFERNNARINLEETIKQKPISEPVKIKKPRGKKPTKPQPVKLGTITNPEPGPLNDCDD